MKQLLEVLFIEDAATDVALMVRELERTDFTLQYAIADDEISLRTALAQKKYHVIIADYNIPGFSGSVALSIAQTVCPEVPFILVSGTIGEENAVNMMRNGAHDYIMKNNLAKLPSVVKRELKEADMRKEKMVLEENIKRISKHVSRVTGTEYLNEITIQLSKTLNTDYTLISLADDCIKDHAQSVTFCKNGVISENIHYVLKGTPCEMVFNNQATIYLDNVQEAFPAIELLKRLNARGYVGIPLTGRNGEVMGAVVTIFKKPVEKASFIETIIQLFSSQISTEIERMKTDELIRYNNILMQQAQHLAHMGNWHWDLKVDKISWSDELYTIYGLNKNDYQPSFSGYLALVHSEDSARVQNSIEMALKNKTSFEFEERIARPNNEIRFLKSWGDVIKDEHDNIIGMFGACLDITERKLAEEALLLSEKKFRSMVHNIADIITLIDEKGNILYESASIQHVLGYTETELIGKNIFELLHPEDAEHIANVLYESIKKEGNSVSVDFRFKNKNGDYVLMEAQGNNQLSNPHIRAMIVNSRDITERRKAEVLLQESKQYYQSLFEHNPDAVYALDFSGKFIIANKGLANMLETTVDDLMKMDDFSPFVPQDEMPRVMHHFIEAQKGIPQHYEKVKILTAKKRKILVNASNIPIYVDGKVVGVYGLAKDITEKERLAALLEKERKQRMIEITNAVISAQESERQILGQELHDNINQVLASAKLYLDLIRSNNGFNKDAFAKCDKLINSSIVEIRQLSHRLITPAFIKDSLAGAIDNLFDIPMEEIRINIHKDYNSLDESLLNDGLKLTVYRIIQEQFNNILKYSKAENVLITLSNEGGPLRVAIKDDGVGVDLSKVAHGVGLMNIKSRAGLLNGEVFIETAPNNGFSLEVIFSESKTAELSVL
ncbi:MAG: PAS domain S-box protein [Flavihumibacter sp.]|nr:PAS domain S-box protein [Flavihumibacter sp.]